LEIQTDLAIRPKFHALSIIEVRSRAAMGQNAGTMSSLHVKPLCLLPVVREKVFFGKSSVLQKTRNLKKCVQTPTRKMAASLFDSGNHNQICVHKSGSTTNKSRVLRNKPEYKAFRLR
jgi:hypothetical protein